MKNVKINIKISDTAMSSLKKGRVNNVKEMM